MKTLLIRILAAVFLNAWWYFRARPAAKHKWESGAGTDWEHFQQPDPNTFLPTLLTMTHQLFHDNHQQQSETDLFWLMNEPVNDISSPPDTPWEF